ncbi:unnamed protein product, partial [Rhizoctonia solani]
MSDNVFKEYLKQKMKADPGFLEKMMAQAAAETVAEAQPSRKQTNCLYLCAPRRAGSANPRKLIRRQLPKTPEPELEPEPEPEPKLSKSPLDSNPPKKTLLENAKLGPTTEKAAGEGAKSVTKGGQPLSELVHI